MRKLLGLGKTKKE